MVPWCCQVKEQKATSIEAEMPIDIYIDDKSLLKMVIFHSYGDVYQRVTGL